MSTNVLDSEAAPAVHAAPSTLVAAPKKRPVLPILGALGLLLALWFGWKWWAGRAYETTDNAQVEGHITPVLPRTGGYVAEVRVADNQQVKAGDTLVVLDDRDLQAALQKSEGELAALLSQSGGDGTAGQATAQAAAQRGVAAAAQASIAQAEANAVRARADVNRLGPLAERNIISRQQLDAAVAAARAADAQVVAARENAAAAGSQVVAAEAGVRALQGRIAAARAAVEQARLQLSYTRVVAPAAGVVAKKSVEVGQLVQPGQPLLSVVPLADVWVTANLKETQLADLNPGDPVELEVDAYPGVTVHGVVESVSPATGARFSLLPPDNATGNFTKVVQRIPVRIRLSDPQNPAHPLRPGMSAEVRIRAR